MKLMRMIMIMT